SELPVLTRPGSLVHTGDSPMPITLSLACSLLLAGAPAGEQADCRALLDQAIQAAGGEAKLARYQGVTLKARGKFHMPEQVAFSGEWAFQAPDKTRVVAVYEAEEKLKVTTVVAGNRGWSKTGDEDAEALDDANLE